MKRSPLTRKSRIRKKPKSRIAHLDRMIRLLVLDLAGNRCEASDVPSVRCGGSLQHAHVITRSVKTLRWRPDNGMCLCGGHHMFFWHKEPLAAATWFKAKWPGRYERLLLMRQAKSRLDLHAEELWLESQLAKRGIPTPS